MAQLNARLVLKLHHTPKTFAHHVIGIGDQHEGVGAVFHDEAAQLHRLLGVDHRHNQAALLAREGAVAVKQRGAAADVGDDKLADQFGIGGDDMEVPLPN